MQFITSGPDIPDHLIQKHEDGNVVFFCGAGISVPAKLPEFKDLVDKLYKSLSVEPNDVQKTAIEAGQYELAIYLLECTYIGGSGNVRKQLNNILSPDLTAKNATATHKALLTLSKGENEQTRLITTNFDRLFEEVITKENIALKHFQAPYLPVRRYTWDGLVYLHGLLSKNPQPNELDDLVLSSADFGRAYLTEGWAARFMSELFRTYTVCFVGYSINDPVIRYMTDALAADRLLNEKLPEMFAFASFSNGKKEDSKNEWKAKNVTPLLYSDEDDHSYLHITLQKWAATYRDGVQGKKSIIIELAEKDPRDSTEENNFVGRMLWALSDSSGLPAQQFAEFNPAPSLDWLDELSPLMTLDNENEKVMNELSNWLIRHLNDPKLLLWLVKRKDKLVKYLTIDIENRLEELETSEKNKLDEISKNAVNAIPNKLMHTLWQLLLTGRIKSKNTSLNFQTWESRFERYGLTATVRFELREVLMPLVAISEPYISEEENNKGQSPKRMKDRIKWKLVLSSYDVHACINKLSEDKNWADALPNLLTDFTALLRDALDLMHELGSADEKKDMSYFVEQPSISKHPQNKNYYDWTVLIELTRDAWLATAKKSTERARLEAEAWWNIKYPLFRRLSFFAAAQAKVIPAKKALDWLLSDEKKWLWQDETRRESIRLLVALAPKLETEMLKELELAILAGPPHSMLEKDQTTIYHHYIWLRLAKISETGTSLNKDGKDKLNELSQQYPEWKTFKDQHDEFTYWQGKHDGDDEDFMSTSIPHELIELVEWLKNPPINTEPFAWQEYCTNNFSNAYEALFTVSKENIWPIKQWQEALQAWAKEELINKSGRKIAQIVIKAPDEIMKELAHSVSFWLKASVKNVEDQDDLFLNLAKKILKINYEVDPKPDDPDPIDHPVGIVTGALFDWWDSQQLEDKQGLSSELAEIFTMLSDTKVDEFRHGRVLLTKHAITLFRVDPDWSKQNLLTLFDWNASEIEAISAWAGFLCYPRLDRSLMNEIKSCFLDTAKHYKSLGKYGDNYASLLTRAALEYGDTFEKDKLHSAIHALPKDGLLASANELRQCLKGAGKKRGDYWKNRVKPFLNNMWPKTKNRKSPDIARALGLLCIDAEDNFEDAFKIIEPWLQPVEYPALLLNDRLCEKFPKRYLEFMSLIIDRNAQTLPRPNIRKCLKIIKSSDKGLEKNTKYQQLDTCIR